MVKKSMIKKLSTPRYIDGGSSVGSYANFNLATHTGDDSQSVTRNRQLLVAHYDLPQEPKWLEQTHSTICLDDTSTGNFGDSIITSKKGVVCCVMTADCLPIFAWVNNTITQQPKIVGVSHAGWQGVFAGVIEEFIASFCSHGIKPADINIEFGTALGQENFEVDTDFYDNFIAKDPAFAQCFIAFNTKYKFDIYHSATLILQKLGVQHINNKGGNTFTNKNCFSYRRDGEKSGRQAHLIWME
jgi:YfiH family protein